MENKRQIESINEKRQNLSFKNAFDSQFDFYLFEKIKKLAVASSLITNHLNDTDEIIKKDIRETSLSLMKKMSFNISHKRQNVSFGFYKEYVHDRYDNVMEQLFKLQSLIQIGCDAFLLNKNNCAVMISVIEELLSEILHFVTVGDDAEDQNHAKVQQAAFFSDSYFNIEKELSESEKTENVTQKSEALHHDTDQNISAQKDAKQSENVASSDMKKNVNHSVPKVVDIKNKNRSSQKGSDAKHQRQNRIIEIIKDKGSVSIKDISRLIVDCSEKTIQRELIELLNQGVIAKEGERRWSTYSMS